MMSKCTWLPTEGINILSKPQRKSSRAKKCYISSFTDPKLESSTALLVLKTINIYLFSLFMAAPAAYGGSQARGRIRVVASGLRQSHSAGSEPHLQPTPQLTATLDP